MHGQHVFVARFVSQQPNGGGHGKPIFFAQFRDEKGLVKTCARKLRIRNKICVFAGRDGTDLEVHRERDFGVIGFVLMALLGFLTGLIPALRAMNLDVVTALGRK